MTSIATIKTQLKISSMITSISKKILFKNLKNLKMSQHD